MVIQERKPVAYEIASAKIHNARVVYPTQEIPSTIAIVMLGRNSPFLDFDDHTQYAIKYIRPPEEGKEVFSETESLESRQKKTQTWYKMLQIFAPSIPVGVANYQFNKEPQSMTISYTENLSGIWLDSELDRGNEFCLVMKQLPQKNRFDIKYNSASAEKKHEYLLQLIERVATLHKQLPPLDREEAERYARFRKLEAKARDNYYRFAGNLQLYFEKNHRWYLNNYNLRKLNYF